MLFYYFLMNLLLFIVQVPIGRGRGARRKANNDSSHTTVGADRIRVAANSSPRLLQPVPTPFIPVSYLCQQYIIFITYL